MGLVGEFKDQYRSIVSDIESYDEPHRTRSLRWLNAGKVAVAVGSVDLIGISTANAVLGFEAHREALQHTLSNIQLYGFAGSLALGLAAVAGVGLAEHSNLVRELDEE